MIFQCFSCLYYWYEKKNYYKILRANLLRTKNLLSTASIKLLVNANEVRERTVWWDIWWEEIRNISLLSGKEWQSGGVAWHKKWEENLYLLILWTDGIFHHIKWLTSWHFCLRQVHRVCVSLAKLSPSFSSSSSSAMQKLSHKISSSFLMLNKFYQIFSCIKWNWTLWTKKNCVCVDI